MRSASTSIDKFCEPSCVPGSATSYVRANQTPLSMHLVPPEVDAFSGQVDPGANWWDVPAAASSSMFRNWFKAPAAAPLSTPIDWSAYYRACDQSNINVSFWSWRDSEDRRFWYVTSSPELGKFFSHKSCFCFGYAVIDDFGVLVMVEGPAR